MSEKRKRGGTKHVQRVPGGANDYVKAEKALVLPENEIDASQLEGNPEARRRFAGSGGVGSISRKPHLDHLLSSAYITCAEVLARVQRNAQATGGALDGEDLRAFTKIAGDVLPKLIREEREQQKAEGLDEMDVEELLELSKEAERVLREETEE